MSNKYSKFLNYCLDHCWKLQKQLGLTNYRISIKQQPYKNKEDWAFQITPNSPYQNALLEWQLETYEEWKKDKKKIQRYLLHEVTHIVIEPLCKVGENRYVTKEHLVDVVEETTDKLTNILFKLLE